MTKTDLPRRAALLPVALLMIGGAALAGDAPRPSAPASDFARDLVAARRANARAQREGRPSVWLAVSPAGARPGKRGPVE